MKVQWTEHLNTEGVPGVADGKLGPFELQLLFHDGTVTGMVFLKHHLSGHLFDADSVVARGYWYDSEIKEFHKRKLEQWLEGSLKSKQEALDTLHKEIGLFETERT